MDINEEKNIPEEGLGGTGYIEQVEIDHEMRTAYIDYSMSVIVSRALPDARDGQFQWPDQEERPYRR